MSPGRAYPSLVREVRVLVTHPDRVTVMAREMGHPPRIIRGPDLCYLFQAQDAERLPSLVDRWEASGIAAQVVQIPPMEGPSPRDSHPTSAFCHDQAGRDPSLLATGPIR